MSLKFSASVLSGETPVYDGDSLIALMFQPETSRFSTTSSLIRRLRHWLLKTLNSISAMFSQLPCTGV